MRARTRDNNATSGPAVGFSPRRTRHRVRPPRPRAAAAGRNVYLPRPVVTAGFLGASPGFPVRDDRVAFGFFHVRDAAALVPLYSRARQRARPPSMHTRSDRNRILLVFTLRQNVRSRPIEFANAIRADPFTGTVFKHTERIQTRRSVSPL